MSRAAVDASEPCVDATAIADAELLNMAAFKLRECAARLQALAGKAQAHPTRELLVRVSRALDGHACALGAPEPSLPGSTAGELDQTASAANHRVK